MLNIQIKLYNLLVSFINKLIRRKFKSIFILYLDSCFLSKPGCLSKSELCGWWSAFSCFCMSGGINVKRNGSRWSASCRLKDLEHVWTSHLRSASELRQIPPEWTPLPMKGGTHQAEQAADLVDGSQAAQEAQEHGEGSDGDQDVTRHLHVGGVIWAQRVKLRGWFHFIFLKVLLRRRRFTCSDRNNIYLFSYWTKPAALKEKPTEFLQNGAASDKTQLWNTKVSHSCNKPCFPLSPLSDDLNQLWASRADGSNALLVLMIQ